MSRNRAKRSRGSHRMVSVDGTAAARHHERRAERVLYDATATQFCEDTLTYWRGHCDRPQFVYFIRATSGGPIKIGTAENPVKRLAELQCGNPETLEIQQVLLGGRDIEKTWHCYWVDAYLRGEWFDGELAAAILLMARGIAEQQRHIHELGEHLHDVIRVASIHWTRAA
jgi:hypothetical protein